MREPTKMLVDAEWLRAKVASDPDQDVEACSSTFRLWLNRVRAWLGDEPPVERCADCADFSRCKRCGGCIEWGETA